MINQQVNGVKPLARFLLPFNNQLQAGIFFLISLEFAWLSAIVYNCSSSGCRALLLSLVRVGMIMRTWSTQECDRISMGLASAIFDVEVEYLEPLNPSGYLTH